MVEMFNSDDQSLRRFMNGMKNQQQIGTKSIASLGFWTEARQLFSENHEDGSYAWLHCSRFNFMSKDLKSYKRHESHVMVKIKSLNNLTQNPGQWTHSSFEAGNAMAIPLLNAMHV